MRIVKEHEERRNEILDCAEELFLTKGYSKTTVADILKKVKIAKGTFYYYFKSKEEIMEAVLIRISDIDITAAQKVMLDDSLSAKEKIKGVLMAQKPKENDKKNAMMDQLHLPENVEIHHKSLELSIKHLAPIMGQIVIQGIDEGIMNTDYPKEVMEFVLTSASFMFDAGLFTDSEDELMKRLYAFVRSVERMLGMEEHSMDFLLEVMLS